MAVRRIRKCGAIVHKPDQDFTVRRLRNFAAGFQRTLLARLGLAAFGVEHDSALGLGIRDCTIGVFGGRQRWRHNRHYYH
jgi:hypothetical protein